MDLLHVCKKAPTDNTYGEPFQPVGQSPRCHVRSLSLSLSLGSGFETGAMAMARNLRLVAAVQRTTFYSSGRINHHTRKRAFCSVLEEGCSSPPLTLANLGFNDDCQELQGDFSKAPSSNGGKRSHKRTPDKALREQTPPAAHPPSAEEMKQAALEASYILAGIAGIRISKPKNVAVSEAVNSNVQRPLQQQKTEAAAVEEEEEEQQQQQDEKEQSNATVAMAASALQEATEPAIDLILNHPWPEWIKFLTDLQTKGFFEGTEKDMEEGKHLFESYHAVKLAVYAFGRTHYETFNCLSRKDLRVLANFGCPDVERKASNASKRLRAHFRIPEGDVCQHCRLKLTCPRAFFAPETNIRMNTLDVVRIVTSFASNAWPNSDNYTSYPAEVGTSVCNLLKEFLTYKILPKKTAEGEYVPTERTSLLEPDPNARKKVKKAKNIPPVDVKPGDWACPNCNFLNFNRNRRCRECNVFRPQQEQSAYIGDWHCPKCRYLNFSKNRYCRECNVERPTKVQWKGGERLPDDPAADKLSLKEKKYEASDDEMASDETLTNPDDSSISGGSLSEEEERALSRGLSNAARRLAKPTFRWDDTEEDKKGLLDSSQFEKRMKVPRIKSERVIGRTLRKQHTA